MKKTVRSTYPVEFSVGLLILIFVLSYFLSSQLFDISWRELIEGRNMYVFAGMFLVSGAVIIMVLILWEEFLFPIRIKPGKDGMVFRNHRNKLNTQLLIYCIIPAIFTYVYFNFELHHVRFFIWAAICILMPVLVTLVSGLKNYNDFLRLTDTTIEFKNNRKSGIFKVSEISRLTPIRDENNTLHKFEIRTADTAQIIDLDEMELEAFLSSIDEYISTHYKRLLL